MKKRVIIGATFLLVGLAMVSMKITDTQIVGNVFAAEQCLEVEEWIENHQEVEGYNCWQINPWTQQFELLGPEISCESGGGELCGRSECKWWRSDCLLGPIPEGGSQ